MTRQLSQLDVALVSYFQKCGLSVFGSFFESEIPRAMIGLSDEVSS